MSKQSENSGQADQPEQAVDFDGNLKRLEECIRRLELGNLPLEQSLQQYGLAVQLIAVCQSQLNKAQHKIELLSGIDADGHPVKRRLKNQGDLTLEEKQSARSNRRSAKRDIKPGDDPDEDDPQSPRHGQLF